MTVSSIIMATAGPSIYIRDSIQSLVDVLGAGGSAEVIIVDNNSSKDLSDKVRALCAAHKGHIRYFKEESPGLSAARHCGAQQAQADVLTFIDDDVIVTPRWLKAIQSAFSDTNVAITGGPSIPSFTGSVPVWFWDFLTPTKYGGWMCTWLSLLDFGGDVLNIEPNYIWGLNFSIRKSVLYSCGGFHPDLVPARYTRWQGDGETGLTRKVGAEGLRADYVQDALVFHRCGPERLRTEYFKKRAYYQGVCDSFAEVRHRYGLAGYEEPSIAHGVYRKVRGSFGRLVRVAREAICDRTAKAASIRLTAELEARKGWNFHQKQIAADPELLKWALRPDYFGTDIREQARG